MPLSQKANICESNTGRGVDWGGEGTARGLFRLFYFVTKKLIGIVGDIIASMNKASQVLSGGKSIAATYSIPRKTTMKLSRLYTANTLFIAIYFNMFD